MFGKSFFGSIDIIAQKNAYLEDLDESYYFGVVNVLAKRWAKCMALEMRLLKSFCGQKSVTYSKTSEPIINIHSTKTWELLLETNL